MRYVPYNPNPTGKNVGDCTVRAISKALGQSWEETYVGLVLQGFIMGDMPSANAVWGAYLRKNNFIRQAGTVVGKYLYIFGIRSEMYVLSKLLWWISAAVLPTTGARPIGTAETAISTNAAGSANAARPQYDLG